MKSATDHARIYAEAYPIKESYGGGFKAFALCLGADDKRVGEPLKSTERFDTLPAARAEAKRLANRLMVPGLRYRPGYYNNRRKDWRCNYWRA